MSRLCVDNFEPKVSVARKFTDRYSLHRGWTSCSEVGQRPERERVDPRVSNTFLEKVPGDLISLIERNGDHIWKAVDQGLECLDVVVGV